MTLKLPQIFPGKIKSFSKEGGDNSVELLQTK